MRVVTRVFEDSSSHARASALHDFLHFGHCGHRSVSGRSHRQRAMSRAVFDRELRPLADQEAVDQSGRERIAAADAVEDFEVLAQPRLMELAVAITYSAPIVDRRRLS